MRIVLISLAASLAAASPALASEGRIEARGGVIWNGDTDATAGAAMGYDLNFGSIFVGPEVSADKILTSGTQVAVGFTGRLGAELGDAGKVYANGGYTTAFCDTCEANWHFGGGYQHNLSSGLYGKVEYRRYMPKEYGVDDSNAVTVGLGIRFR